MRNKKELEKRDEAWNQLYMRLNNDGLIVNDLNNKKRLSSPQLLKWIAAIAIVSISIVYTLYVNKSSEADKQLMLVHNNNETTLVKTLEDNSIVYIDKGTSLYYPEHFSAESRKVNLKGKALFDVAGNSEHPFLIDTDLAIVEVVGTKFLLESDNYFDLFVKEGEVKVTSKSNGESILLLSGESASIIDGQIQKGINEDDVLFVQYIKHLQFKDESLKNIVRVINRNSEDGQLQISKTLDERRLTVTFADDSPQVIAQLICAALNLQCSQNGNNIYISEPK